MTNTLQFKSKISRAKFEDKIINDFGNNGLVRSIYVEEGVRLSLYYINDFHIGTHGKGEGWLFISAYKKFKPDIKK